jgi:hypothetical protein
MGKDCQTVYDFREKIVFEWSVDSQLGLNDTGFLVRLLIPPQTIFLAR